MSYTVNQMFLLLCREVTDAELVADFIVYMIEAAERDKFRMSIATLVFNRQEEQQTMNVVYDAVSRRFFDATDEVNLVKGAQSRNN